MRRRLNRIDDFLHGTIPSKLKQGTFLAILHDGLYIYRYTFCIFQYKGWMWRGPAAHQYQLHARDIPRGSRYIGSTVCKRTKPWTQLIRAVAGQRSSPKWRLANKTKMFFRAKIKRRKITGPWIIGHCDLNLFWGERSYNINPFSKRMTFIHQILFKI